MCVVLVCVGVGVGVCTAETAEIVAKKGGRNNNSSNSSSSNKETVARPSLGNTKTTPQSPGRQETPTSQAAARDRDSMRQQRESTT